MVEVRGAWAKNQRGAQAKNQGGPSLFLKILHTKKKNLGSSPLCPLPGSVPGPINFLCPPIVWFHLSLELGMNAKFWKKKKEKKKKNPHLTCEGSYVKDCKRSHLSSIYRRGWFPNSNSQPITFGGRVYICL